MEVQTIIEEIIANQKPIDLDTIQGEIEKIKAESVVTSTDLKTIFSLIDLTTLEGKDTDEKVKQFSNKAIQVKKDYPELETTVAAICVFPARVKAVANQISDTEIQLASVATGFPSGQLPLELKIAEVNYAIAQGATEIDMVISRGNFLSKDYVTVFNEIKAVKDVCGKARLKVILETGELETIENIRLASDIAIAAGADFIKTSTGKIPQGASLEAIYVMSQAIKDHFDKTGIMVGIKPSGGISTPEVAKQYTDLVESILDKNWINPKWMRFGASSLAGNVLAVFTKQENTKSYFSSSSSY